MADQEVQDGFARMYARKALERACATKTPHDELQVLIDRADSSSVWAVISNFDTLHEYREILFRALSIRGMLLELGPALARVNNRALSEKQREKDRAYICIMHRVMLPIIMRPVEQLEELFSDPEEAIRFLGIVDFTPRATFEHFLSFATPFMCKQVIWSQYIQLEWRQQLLARAGLLHHDV
jgi:hypothetical protein